MQQRIIRSNINTRSKWSGIRRGSRGGGSSQERRRSIRRFDSLIQVKRLVAGFVACAAAMGESGGGECAPYADMRRRDDGVKILHDPLAAGMVEKYGAPGETDDEGFDPYADTVGPGIYGGIVKRDADGEIVIGRQYQDHNRRPGPVYAGGGYTPMSTAVHQGEEALRALLDRFPDLVNDVSTGGATPLHVCGMSQRGQRSTAYVIERGGNVEAVDTYGYRPLHRMASNNLATGAEALLAAGADVNAETWSGQTPLFVALSADAQEVADVIRRHGGRDIPW